MNQEEITVGSIGPVQEIQKPAIMTIEGPDGRKAPVLFIPKADGGMEVKEGLPIIEAYQPREAPHRRRGTAVLESLASFVDHVHRFREAHTAIFVRRSPPMIEAVYDYATKDAPRFGEHRAMFAFPATKTWQEWKGKHGAEMNQVQFAQFIEDRFGDLIAPEGLPPSAQEAIKAAETAVGTNCVPPEAIRALGRGLDYHKTASGSEVFNLRNGDCKVSFEEKTVATKQGETIDIPGLFAIAIELFDARMPGEPDPTDPTKRLPARPSLYVIPVRLRVRPGNGEGIRWILLLHNIDRCIDLALGEAADRVTAETECPVYWGSPEATK